MNQANSTNDTDPKRALRVIAIAGSLRRASLNRALIQAARGLAPSGVTIEIAEIRDIPLYDADLTTDGKPAAVAAFEAQIADADAVLIATPEYNYGIPGVLKNALDWASRPAYRSVFAGKPVAILGASGSTVGTARAQGQLKQVLLGMVAEVFPYPEVLVARAHERIVDGELIDEGTRGIVAEMLGAFAEWATRRRVAGD